MTDAELRTINDARVKGFILTCPSWSWTFVDEEDRKLQQVIAHYRSLAAEAQEASSSATVEKYRKAYGKMAKHWIELAREIEECLGWPDGTLH
jgi:hypothetical protein